MTQRIDNMTLRQKLNEADKLSRELIHHLEHGFIPKAHVLRRTARQGNDPTEILDTTDRTIRTTADGVVASDQFTRQVTEQLNDVLAAIDKDVQRNLGG